MSLFGARRGLERVPSIWTDDARKLAQCGVMTVDDLVRSVRQNGLSALSEETDIPSDQLRSYLEVAERESSQTRTRRGGEVLLSLAAVPAIWLAIRGPVYPDPKAAGYEEYKVLYDLYTGRDTTLSELRDSIEPIVNAFLAYNSATSASDSGGALEELNSRLCGECQAVDTSTKELTPQFASLLNLGAAVMHETAGRQRDTRVYDSLFDITSKLYERLGQTPSYRESAPVNLRRTREERDWVYLGMRSTLDPADLVELRESINTEIRKLETRVAEAQDSLKAVRGSVEALAGDQAEINSAIAPIPASIREVEKRLADQLRLLEELKGMVSDHTTYPNPVPEPVKVASDCPGYVLQDESTVVRDLRRHLRTLDSDVELVTLELQVDKEGRVPEGGAELIGHPNERLGKAVQEAAQDFLFQVPDSTCEKLRYEILFQR